MLKVTTAYVGGTLFETEVGKHVIHAEMPAAVGGHDDAPTPPQLLLASLGSCVGGSIVYYCQQAGLDTRDLSVDVFFDRGMKPYRLENLKVAVHLPHAQLGDQVEFFRQAAQNCPVHLTIKAANEIEFELFDESTLEPTV